MSKEFYACVYGGASDKLDDIYKKESEKLGRVIAENGFSMVYGAGATGCMGAAAKGVREAGGYILGIAPHFMKEFEEIFECDRTVMVETMSERKTLMEEKADIFVIAPGGIGTLDELFQVLTLKHLKRITAPVVILNIDGFYDSLESLMQSLIKTNALHGDVHALYDVVTSAEDEALADILKKVKNS